MFEMFFVESKIVRELQLILPSRSLRLWTNMKSLSNATMQDLRVR